MTFLSTVTLSEYNGNELRNPAALRRHKLAEKIEQQILLAADPNYRPTKVVWNLGEDGVERMFERPKRIKRWWIETVTGRLLLTVDLSRICAAPSARLGHLAFEGQGAFASQC